MSKVSRILKRLNALEGVDRTKVMHRLGVEPLRSATERAMPPAGGFGLGFGVGVGVGMLISPKPGNELRDDIVKMVSGCFSRSDSEAGSGLSTSDADSPKDADSPTDVRSKAEPPQTIFADSDQPSGSSGQRSASFTASRP